MYRAAAGRGSSAFVSHETETLGTVDALVAKDGASVSIQFRANEDGEAAIRKGMPQLEAVLREAGYSPDNISFAAVGEQFAREEEKKRVTQKNWQA
jgi:hypothetical protein